MHGTTTDLVRGWKSRAASVTHVMLTASATSTHNYPSTSTHEPGAVQVGSEAGSAPRRARRGRTDEGEGKEYKMKAS
jgi:hypothetical protein